MADCYGSRHFDGAEGRRIASFEAVFASSVFSDFGYPFVGCYIYGMSRNGVSQ